jgi:hypothetical protein
MKSVPLSSESMPFLDLSIQKISILGVCLALLSGCQDAQIESYEVAKEAQTIDHNQHDHAHDHDHQHEEDSVDTGAAVGDEVRSENGNIDIDEKDESPDGDEQPTHAWKLPSTWVQETIDRPMRVATFQAPTSLGDIEVALTRFGGTVGGTLANINRWRGQMGLPAVDESQLVNLVSVFETPGYSGYSTRITGDNTEMHAWAIYDINADHTWFVRATATTEAIDELQQDIEDLAMSLTTPFDNGDG